MMMFSAKFCRGRFFIGWTSFTLPFFLVCLCLGCVHVIYGPWSAFCVICCSFCIFFVIRMPANYMLFLLSVVTPAKHALTIHFCPTSPCFPVPPCKRTPLYPCEPMCTHLEPSVTFFVVVAKHDVRGNFPGHRVKNMSCTTIFCLRLPCFCVSPCSYVLTHPYKPMHTYLHLFTFVKN